MIKISFNSITLAALMIMLFTQLSNAAIVISRQPIAKIATPEDLDTPTTRYSHGDPSDESQYLLEITNRCRANPYADLNRILASDDIYIQRAFEAFDVDINVLNSDFATYSSKPPLAFNPQLIDAALGHCYDMKYNNFQGHVSTDGSTLGDRLTDAGYDYTFGGENVYAYARSEFHAHAAFVIDWGVDDLGHRINILNLDDSYSFREIGIAIIEENLSSTEVGPLIVTQDFGFQSTQVVFVTGVVYSDENGNNFYDPGEGLAGIQIMPDHGEYYAETSSSGGYAIPVTIYTGSYAITATGSEIDETTQNVNITNKNVQLNFQFPLDPSSSDTVNTPDSVELSCLTPAIILFSLLSLSVLSICQAGKSKQA